VCPKSLGDKCIDLEAFIRVHEVVFDDGEATENGANVIAENTWAEMRSRL
jgi:hypothetical protein